MELVALKFREYHVRHIIDKNGNPWWVAQDVCEVLGLSNAREALSRLDDDEKNTVRISDGIPGNPNMNIVNEPGIYNLVLRSNKPEAQEFGRWIRHEVLPSIRKQGSYNIDQQPVIGELMLRCIEESPTIRRMDMNINGMVNSIGRVDTNVLYLVDRLPKSPISKATKELHDAVIEEYFQGKCPCCMERKATEYEHYKHPSWSSPTDTWKTCRKCNSDKLYGKLDLAFLETMFRGYQGRLEQYCKRYKIKKTKHKINEKNNSQIEMFDD